MELMPEQIAQVESVAEQVRKLKLDLVEQFKKEVSHVSKLTRTALINGYVRGLDDMFGIVYASSREKK